MWNVYFIPFSLSVIYYVLYRSKGQCIYYYSKLFNIVTKNFVRLICRAKRLDHTSCLFSELRILKVPDIVEIRTAHIMYKTNNHFLPVIIQKVFTLYKSVYVTRRSPTLKKIFSYQFKENVYLN